MIALKITYNQLQKDKQQLLDKLEENNLQPEDILHLKIIDAKLKAIREYEQR